MDRCGEQDRTGEMIGHKRDRAQSLEDLSGLENGTIQSYEANQPILDVLGADCISAQLSARSPCGNECLQFVMGNFPEYKKPHFTALANVSVCV